MTQSSRGACMQSRTLLIWLPIPQILIIFLTPYTLPNYKNVKRGPYMQKGLITFQSIKVIGKRSGAEQKFEFRWKRRPRALAQEQYSVILLFGGSIISSVESREKASCRSFFSDWRCVLSADRAAAATARWPGWRRRWRNRHHSPPPAPIMPASRYKFSWAASYIHVVCVCVCAYFNNSGPDWAHSLERWVIYLPLRSQTQKCPAAAKANFDPLAFTCRLVRFIIRTLCESKNFWLICTL